MIAADAVHQRPTSKNVGAGNHAECDCFSEVEAIAQVRAWITNGSNALGQQPGAIERVPVVVMVIHQTWDNKLTSRVNHWKARRWRCIRGLDGSNSTVANLNGDRVAVGKSRMSNGHIATGRRRQSDACRERNWRHFSGAEIKPVE